MWEFLLAGMNLDDVAIPDTQQGGKMYRTVQIALTTALAPMLLAGSSLAMTNVESTFATDSEGWTATAPAEVVWTAAGGNPGGYMRFEDGSGGPNYMIAPSVFLGNWAGRTELRFDHRIFHAGDIDMIVPYEVAISGPGGSAIWLGSTPSGNTPWTTQLVPIDEAAWTVQAGTWSALMADVTDLQIRVELVINPVPPQDISGIDNVILVQQQPVPAVGSLGGLALGVLTVGAGTLLLRRQRPPRQHCV